MSANFTPTQSAIKDLKPFRFWCQKVLPTVYDDSLSYYELLTKVVNYLNDTIDNVEALNDNVQNIYNAYILLQNYVNEYFDQNFPQLVSDKLDEMAEDGTLTALIRAYIDPYFEAKSAEIEEAFDAQNDRIDNAIETQNDTISEAISDQNGVLSAQTSSINQLTSRMDAFVNQHSGLSGETLLYDGSGTPAYTTGSYLALSDALANYKYLRFVWKHRGEVCVQDFEIDTEETPAQNYNLRDTISAPAVQSGGSASWEMCNIVVINATNGSTNQLELGGATVIDNFGYNDGPIDGNMNTGILKVIGIKDVSDTEVVDARVGADGTIYSTLEERLNAENSELKSALQSYEDIFTGDVDESVQNWLNTHPEATTTVQDGSLTEAKFTDALKLKTIKEYVTPEMYGAVGDGVTDDTQALQLALASGKTLLIPTKTYYIATPINNPTTFNMLGMGSFNINGKKSIIKTNDKIFANNISYSSIKSITFLAPTVNTITAFPTILLSSIVENCVFDHYNAIFDQVLTTCKIVNNYFTAIQSFFCGYTVDSDFIGNYINAPKVKNPKTRMISYGAIHSKFVNNFVDFMYSVFKPYSAVHMQDVIVSNNTFDYCFTIFYDYCRFITFTGNTLSNIKKNSTVWDVSENAEMSDNKWCVIRRTKNQSALANCVFGNNSFDNVESYLVSDVASYPTMNLIIDEPLSASYFDFKAIKSGTSGDMTVVKIRPMLKRTVDALPSPSITSSTLIVSFNHDEVIYNGDLYMNIDGAWKQITT